MLGRIKYSFSVGSYLIIWIRGENYKFIARVTSFIPLEVEVVEEGEYANLSRNRFDILHEETAQFQKDRREDSNVFLETENLEGRIVVSGLRSLGITDDKLHEIIPVAL